MSRTTTSTTAPTEHPVTALSGATAAVYTELCGHEAITAAALALAAEVSPSAARKSLVDLEQQGLAWRTPGGNDRTRKLPDLWHPTTPASDPTPAHPNETANPAETLHGEAELPHTPETATDENAWGDTTPQHDPQSGTGGTADADERTAANEGSAEGWAEATQLPRRAENTAHADAGDGVPVDRDLPPEALRLADSERETAQHDPSGSTDEATWPVGSPGSDADTVPHADAENDEDGPATAGTSGVVDGAQAGREPTASDGGAAAVPDSTAASNGDAGAPVGTDPGAGGASGLTDSATGATRSPDSEAPVAPADHTCVCATCGAQMPPRGRKRAAAAVTSGGPRLMAGALHGMVLEHLRANPDQEWTPTGIAKILGRSSGAIGNALTAMVDRGAAVMTCTKPRRYQVATSATDNGPGKE